MSDRELPDSEQTDPVRDPYHQGQGDDVATNVAERGTEPGSDDPSSSGGQVSEVGNLDGGPAPISDGQSVAGQPDGESGEVDEGPQGPNARTGSTMPDGPQPDQDGATRQ